MTLNTTQELQEKTPDLTLKKEALDFFYEVCGYTPIPKISEALTSSTFGFFSERYKIMD